MKQFKKFAKVIISMIMVAVMFAACGNNGGTSADKVLNIAETDPSNNLFSITNAEAVNSRIIYNFQEGLFRRNLDNVVEPGIAESFEVSADGTVYTFKIRKDAKWANGTPVTANDFVFAWRKNATIQAAAYRGYTDVVKNGKPISKGEMAAEELGAVAIDDQTFEVTLESPVAYFSELLATIPLMPINEAFYNEVGGDEAYGTSAETVMSNGPYILSEYDAKAGYKLTKNPDYWDAKNVDIETVNVHVIPSIETQAVMWDSGEIDRIELKGDLVDKYDGDSHMEVQKESRTSYIYLSGDTKTPSPLLSNLNFRKAVAYAIDKKMINETILKDGSIGADYIIPRGLVSNEKGQDFRDYAKQYNDPYFDVAKAKEFLEKAKAELGATPLEFTMATPDVQPTKKMMESIVAQINENLPGVTVTLESHPRATYYNTLFEHSTPSAFYGWGASIVDPVTYFDLWTDISLNFPNFKNDDYMKAYKEAAGPEAMNNPEKRWDLFVEQEKIVLDSFVVIPVTQKGTKILVADKVEGMTGNAEQANIYFRTMKIK